MRIKCIFLEIKINFNLNNMKPKCFKKSLNSQILKDEDSKFITYSRMYRSNNDWLSSRLDLSYSRIHITWQLHELLCAISDPESHRNGLDCSTGSSRRYFWSLVRRSVGRSFRSKKDSHHFYGAMDWGLDSNHNRI